MMFDLSGMTALVTGASGGLAARSPRRCPRRARGWRCRGRMRPSWRRSPRSWAAIMWRWSATCRIRQRSTSWCRARSRRWRQARHPRQQCRHHPRQPRHADEGRGVRRGHQGQSRSRLPPDARGDEADDEGALRPDHLGHLGGRRDRQSRPGQLCRVQGRADRHVQGVRAGSREPRDHRQLRRAGLHDLGHDRCAK